MDFVTLTNTFEGKVLAAIEQAMGFWHGNKALTLPFHVVTLTSFPIKPSVLEFLLI